MSWATLNTTQNEAAAAVLTTLAACLATTEGQAAVAAIAALTAANVGVGMSAADAREFTRRVVVNYLDEEAFTTDRDVG